MKIAKTMKRWLLVIPGCLLLSAVTWGQGWGPTAAAQVEIGAPQVRLVQVDRRWDDGRDDRRNDRREREWRERRERERREEWRRHHRREERRGDYRY